VAGALALVATVAVAVAAAPAGAQGVGAPVETWVYTPPPALDAQYGFFWSSPNLAQLPSGPAVVVGDRAGFLYAVPLNSTGTATQLWDASTNGTPIDSTPSVEAGAGGQTSAIFVGTGNAAVNISPNDGYWAFGPGGGTLWHSLVVDPPTDMSGDNGVQASLTVAPLQGTTAVMAGSLDQEAFALNAANGQTLTGWPYFTGDSVFSTAAAADLYGTGRTELVEGGDQSTGFALGQNYTQGGHLRILNDRGGVICHYDATQSVYSSPAVGGFLAGGATGEVVGTGFFFGGASDSNKVLAFDSACHLQWSTTLDGITESSPALANVTGDGHLDVVEGTAWPSADGSGNQGSVYALNGTTGAVLWRTPLAGQVVGSVVTADLTGQGYQDVIVQTTAHRYVLDGRTGQVALQFPDYVYGNNGQSAPLVTNDANGTIGVTFAFWHLIPNTCPSHCEIQGSLEHFEFPNPGAVNVGAFGAWPMFHHDPQLTGDAGGTPAPGAVPACTIPAAAFSGYDEVASDGGIFSFGGQPFCGSTGALRLNAPIVGMAMAPNTGGYWLVASDGGIFAYGGARFYGSMGGRPLNQPIVAMAATPDGAGYWLVASDGGVFAFGDAPFWGSTGALRLNQPIVGFAPTPDGRGYVAADGGVFTFGSAQYFGSDTGLTVGDPDVDIATSVTSGGYWTASARGELAPHNATFMGSAAGGHLSAPVVALAPTADGYGYRMAAADGSLFVFGDAGYAGSMGGRPLNRPIVGLAGF
jgi:hypothetical protein